MTGRMTGQKEAFEASLAVRADQLIDDKGHPEIGHPVY